MRDNFSGKIDRYLLISDPPSVHPLPESGELEINLGETVDMACVAKGIPVPIISWKFRVIIILQIIYSFFIRVFNFKDGKHVLFYFI